MMALQSLRLSYTGFPSEILIEDSMSQPLNASVPMFVTVFGMTIELKFLQLANADLPMVVTEFGMVTDFIFRHPPKVWSSITLTD